MNFLSFNQNKEASRSITCIEEVFNAAFHGIGVALSIAGLVLLVIAGASRHDVWKVVAFSIYGSTLIMLFLSSTMHHSLVPKTAKKVFLIFDHAAIFLLIAGTYTPFVLVSLRGPVGWTVFGISWGIAVFGVVFKSLFIGRFELVGLVLYGIMGWMIVFFFRDLSLHLGPLSSMLLIVGGIAYTLGIPFYVLDNRFFFHPVWHLFVLAGAVLHWFCIYIGIALV